MNSDKENPKKNQKITNNEQPYEVTAEGSLGLLALGSEGIRAWRKKREEEKIKSITKLKDE